MAMPTGPVETAMFEQKLKSTLGADIDLLFEDHMAYICLVSERQRSSPKLLLVGNVGKEDAMRLIGEIARMEGYTLVRRDD